MSETNRTNRMVKRIAYAILEFIDHDILRCRWRRLCAWLLYSDVWQAERDFWDHRIKSLSARYEREAREHPGVTAEDVEVLSATCPHRWTYHDDDATVTCDLCNESRQVSPDQDWYWTPEWQAKEREADEDLAAGRYRVYETLEEFVAGLGEGRDG